MPGFLPRTSGKCLELLLIFQQVFVVTPKEPNYLQDVSNGIAVASLIMMAFSIRRILFFLISSQTWKLVMEPVRHQLLDIFTHIHLYNFKFIALSNTVAWRITLRVLLNEENLQGGGKSSSSNSPILTTTYKSPCQ